MYTDFEWNDDKKGLKVEFRAWQRGFHLHTSKKNDPLLKKKLMYIYNDLKVVDNILCRHGWFGILIL